MSTLNERLASLAGLTLKESDFPRFKTIKIALADVGLDDQPDDVIMQFAAKAAEQNDVVTIEDWRVNRMAGTLEFDPMLSNGEVSPRQIAAFRSFAMDFLSDPENLDTFESVQEGKKSIHDQGVWDGQRAHIPFHAPKGGKPVGKGNNPYAGDDREEEYLKGYEAGKKNKVEEATGSNTPYAELGAWKAAAAKAGLEVYSQGAADGKYTAKRDGEVYGRFNKEQGEGWIHSSAMKEAMSPAEKAEFQAQVDKGGKDLETAIKTAPPGSEKDMIKGFRGAVKAAYKSKSGVKESEIEEAAIGEPWVVHLQFRKEGDTRTWSSANYKLNAPDKERAKSYAIADYKKKGYTDVTAVRATPAKPVKEDAEEYNQPVDSAQQGPLPQGLAEIAQTLGFQTLDAQANQGNSQQVSADAVRTALLAAFNLGKTQGDAETTPAEQQPQSGGLPPPESRTPADHQQAA
jgi:hypothetical protein